MRRSFEILFFMFLLNVSVTIVNGMPIWGGQHMITPYNDTQITNTINGTELGTNWDPPESGGLFGDVKAGIEALTKLNSFINAFPQIWAVLGMPAQIISLFSVVWSFFWWWSIFDLITGGKVFGG